VFRPELQLLMSWQLAAVVAVVEMVDQVVVVARFNTQPVIR
jgi:hypothetical protein